MVGVVWGQTLPHFPLIGNVLGDGDALRLQRVQDGRVMDEVAENRERTRVGVFEGERDGVANTEAHTEVSRPKDAHDCRRIAWRSGRVLIGR